MKRSLVITLFSFVIVIGLFATINSIDLYKDPFPPGPTPRSLLTFFPSAATISEIELTIYFDENIGITSITVYNESNQVVENEVIDTSSTEEVFIPVSEWNSGNYTISISYGSTTLKGRFQIP